MTLRIRSITYRACPLVLGVALLVACSSAGGVAPEPRNSPAESASVSPSPSGSSPTPSTRPSVSGPPKTSSSPSGTAADEAAALSQYRLFFGSLTPLSKVPYDVRYEAMSKLAVDPELTQVMGAIATAQNSGEQYFGTPTLRPKVESISDGKATILDCQDTSKNGRQKIATGVEVSIGRTNSYARVTMILGQDGLWRVSTVGYAAAGSCNATA